MYLLYSMHANGWLSAQGNYTSDWKLAKRFERDEAMMTARRHKSQAGYNTFPVRLEDVEELTQ